MADEGLYVVLRQDRFRDKTCPRARVLCTPLTEEGACDAIDEYCLGCFAQKVPDFKPDIMHGRTPLDMTEEEWDMVNAIEGEWQGRIVSQAFDDLEDTVANSGELNRIEWPADDPEGRVSTEFYWTFGGEYIKESILEDSELTRQLESAYDPAKGQIAPPRGGSAVPDALRKAYKEVQQQ